MLRIIGWGVLVALLVTTAAQADDPNDPVMRDPAARARDSAMIRSLNQRELARVRARDAQMGIGRVSAQQAEASCIAYQARSRDYERAMADYQRDRARYERDLADWRRATAQD